MQDMWKFRPCNSLSHYKSASGQFEEETWKANKGSARLSPIEEVTDSLNHG